MEPPDTDDRRNASPTQANQLVRHIEQLQAAVAGQQRALMRLPDEGARAAALRATGVLVRQLIDLEEAARQLELELRLQASEQDRLRALQEVGAAVNSSLDLQVVLQQVMDAIVRLTRAERAMLLLDVGGTLEVKMARNLSQETLDDAASREPQHRSPRGRNG